MASGRSDFPIITGITHSSVKARAQQMVVLILINLGISNLREACVGKGGQQAGDYDGL